MPSAVRRAPPVPWEDRKRSIRHPLLTPLHAAEHAFEWLAHRMSGWVLIELLEYLGKFSVLIAVVVYCVEYPDRVKQKHYQAWQVINTAQGKGGSGGRIEALHELSRDRVPLVGVDVSGSFLQGVRLEGANLLRSDFQGADIRNGAFKRANLSYSNLSSANFREADLSNANLEGASLADADLNGANLAGTRLTGADLSNTDLRAVDLRGADWSGIHKIQGAQIHAIRNAPAGFRDWAMKSGAADSAAP